MRAREARIRKNFLHETSTELAKSHGLLVLEDLAVTAMTRSARGTIEAPGKNVRAKAGLNRAILAQGWGEFARHLEYKAPGRVVYVPAHNTSRRCHRCGNVATENRLTRRSFVCTRCGYAGDADVNAAQNILAAGLGRNSARSPLRRHGTEARTPRLAGLDVAA